MTKEYYELRNNRISKVHKEIILQALESYRSQAFNMKVKAVADGKQSKERFWSKRAEIIEETLNWLNSNIDSYPSMEFEKTRKTKSVGNTMGQFDIYLDEFIEKEK